MATKRHERRQAMPGLQTASLQLLPGSGLGG
jgi:hypothetical protein